MSRIKTLVRVAELQEAAAKGSAAKALAAARASEQSYLVQLQLLRESRLAGGTREALALSATSQQAQAAAVVAADTDRAEAADAQRDAITAWTAARRRHRLFSELAQRKREEQAAQRERQDQQLADEIASSRAATRGRR